MTPCQSCHAGCCRAFAVPISGADVIRIESRLNLSFWDFACRWADPNGDIALNHAPQFRFEDELQTPFVICLKHIASEFFPDSDKCRFLMESPPDADHPLGVARCGIHGHRPGACRAYPTKLNSSSELVIIDNVPDNGRPNGEDLYRLCPRQWEPSDIDPLDSVQDLVLAKYEMAFFQQVASAWNRNPQSWLVFPEFLRLIYSHRVTKGDVAVSDDSDHNILPFPTQEHAPTKSSKAA